MLRWAGGASAPPFCPARPRTSGRWPPTLPSTSVPTVARIDAAFQDEWHEQQARRRPADAPELAWLRRISLGLTGTIPSLEEIRRFESLARGPSRDSVGWQRRWPIAATPTTWPNGWPGLSSASTTDPFLLVPPPPVRQLAGRRAGRQRPLRRDRAAPDRRRGLWTDTPATNFITVTINPGDEDHAGSEPAGGPRGPRVPRRAHRLRRMPRPSVRPVEAARLSKPGRFLRRDAAEPARHLATATASTRSRIARPAKLETIALQRAVPARAVAGEGNDRQSPGRLGHHPDNRPFRPRGRQSGLGPAVRPAAGRADRRPAASPARCPRRSTFWPTISWPTATTGGGCWR